jgi:hypothetical protein
VSGVPKTHNCSQGLPDLRLQRCEIMANVGIRRLAAGLLMGLALLPGCSGDMGGDELDDGAIEEVAQQLWVNSVVIWPSLTIPVCWESPTAATATARGWVKDQVTRIWQNNSQLKFTGWGTCSAKASGIRIRIADEASRTVALGSDLDGIVSGMTLNLTMVTTPNYAACRATYGLESCVRTTAAHEFGHALGFAHEEMRVENYEGILKGDPNACLLLGFGELGDSRIGTYDKLSVMNSCRILTPVSALSATDKRGLQAFYGHPSPASIRKDAINWDNETTYFFFGNRYIAYSLSQDKIMDLLPDGPAFPALIKEGWRGWPSTSPWTGGTDVVVPYSSTKVLFFSGSQYLRMDRKLKTVDAGYPKTLPSGWTNWPAHWTSVDSALRWPANNRVYLFRGSEYIRITGMTVDAGYPRPVAGNWNIPYTTGFDYAFPGATGKVYFVKGSQYVRVDVASDRVDAGPFSMVGRWPGVTF